MQYAGENFSLRKLAFDDAELINRYENTHRQHLQPWEPLRDDDYFILENARSRVQQQWESMQVGSAFFFLITAPDGELLGRCSYTNIVRGAFQACNLGFSLAETAQGQGLMKRSLEVTNRYCFEHMGLHRIMANHLPHNLKSQRLLQSLGFEQEGYARAYLKIADVWEDHVLRALINPNEA